MRKEISPKVPEKKKARTAEEAVQQRVARAEVAVDEALKPAQSVREDIERAVISALLDADAQGKLGIVAMVIGKTEPELRQIMNNGAHIDPYDLAVLSAHLERQR